MQLSLDNKPTNDSIFEKLQFEWAQDLVECSIKSDPNGCFAHVTANLQHLVCDSTAGDECRDKLTDFLTRFNWACPSRNAMGGIISNPVYPVELDIRMVESSMGDRCTNEVSCPCVSTFYLFGNYNYWKTFPGQILNNLKVN